MIKNYLVDKKAEIKELKVVERDVEIEKTKGVGNALIGPRRAGKSFSCFHLIKNVFKLGDEEYLFVNFEDDEIKNIRRSEKTKVVQTHAEIYGKEPMYIFLDEIQSLEKWESFVYSLVEKKRYFIFLTGSSSKLLSREIATQLRGRCFNTVIFPFSFREFLRINDIEIKEPLSTYTSSKIKYYLSEYLKNGGFPQVVLKEVKPKNFFREYLNTVLYKDLVERFEIENLDAARFLLNYMVNNFSKEFSINRIYNTVKGIFKISKKTLYSYTSYIQQTFFSFLLRKFDWSMKKVELSVPKIYVNDTGIAFNSGHSFSENTGRLMENLVFLELKKMELGNRIDEIFYWKDYQQREVDFVVRDGLRVKRLIQVTYAGGRDEVEPREIKSLLKAAEIFKRDRPELSVITWDYEAVEEVKGKRIKFIPLWRWLLNR